MLIISAVAIVLAVSILFMFILIYYNTQLDTNIIGDNENTNTSINKIDIENINIQGIHINMEKNIKKMKRVFDNMDSILKYQKKMGMSDSYISYEDFCNMSIEKIMKDYMYLFNTMIKVFNINKPYKRSKINMETYNIENKNGIINKGLELYSTTYSAIDMKKELDDIYNNPNENISFVKSGKGIEKMVADSDYLSIDDIMNYLPNIYPIINSLHMQFRKIMNRKSDGENNANNINDMKFSIARYSGKKGIKHHIDSIAGKPSDIFVWNIGAKVYYDMISVVCDDLYINNTNNTNNINDINGIRVEIPDGNIIRLYMDMRYKWTHSIPDGLDLEGRYAIMFKYI